MKKSGTSAPPSSPVGLPRVEEPRGVASGGDARSSAVAAWEAEKKLQKRADVLSRRLKEKNEKLMHAMISSCKRRKRRCR